MNTYANKTQINNRESIANAVSQKKSKSQSTFQFVDNRPEAIAQRKIQEIANNSPQVKQAARLQSISQKNSLQKQPIQKKINNTGLPDNLKSGIENLSGYSMDDVKVHYNSDKPAQLHAHAYAQGSDIHVASGQEKHLAHEAWHVVQQKQGRVKPTIQMKGKVNVNDDTGLENEADVMGEAALKNYISLDLYNDSISKINTSPQSSNTVQRAVPRILPPLQYPNPQATEENREDQELMLRGQEASGIGNTKRIGAFHFYSGLVLRGDTRIPGNVRASGLEPWSLEGDGDIVGHIGDVNNAQHSGFISTTRSLDIAVAANQQVTHVPEDRIGYVYICRVNRSIDVVKSGLERMLNGGSRQTNAETIRKKLMTELYKLEEKDEDGKYSEKIDELQEMYDNLYKYTGDLTYHEQSEVAVDGIIPASEILGYREYHFDTRSLGKIVYFDENIKEDEKGKVTLMLGSGVQGWINIGKVV